MVILAYLYTIIMRELMRKRAFFLPVIFMALAAASCGVWNGLDSTSGSTPAPVQQPDIPPVAQTPPTPYPGRPSHGGNMPHGRYAKDTWNVYYQGRKVDGASASSFVDLGAGYGKDTWSVYYQGRKIDASSSSFVPLDDGYAKDTWCVYYQGRKIDASSSSFIPLGWGYAKDTWSVYYKGRKIKASLSSFVNLGRGYAKDAWNVYYNGEVVRDASPGSFNLPRR